LELMQKDEYLEVTPQSVRLRKIHLTQNAAAKAARG
jgi:predicted membrane GTPase involved in stress response